MRTHQGEVVIWLLGAAMLLASYAPAIRARPESPAQDSPNSLAGPASGLLFIENAGQFAPAARFRVWGGGNLSWLAADSLWVTTLEVQPTVDDQRPTPVGESSSFVPGHSSSSPIRGFNIKVSFAGANPQPVVEPFGRRESRVSYYLGDDPADWRPNVPVWSGVRYRDLYPGVDLEVFSENGSWAWQVVLHPEAGDPEHALSLVRLQIEGAPFSTVTLPALVAGFSYSSNKSSSVNSTLPMTPLDDPSDLVYGTFLGGSDFDSINTMTVNAAGSAYVTGDTSSPDFPATPGAFDTDLAGEIDVFVAKFTPNGSDLEYATFLGGGGSDIGGAIAVDEQGYAFVSGTTTSTNFPTVAGSYDTSHNGSEDLFLVKLAPAGDSLVYGTFLGGGRDDYLSEIAVDAAGRVFLVGTTMSSDFPTTVGAFSPSCHRLLDGFVVQFNAAGTSLNYSTYLGGDHDDWIGGMAVDGQGNAFLTGYTQSEDFPVTPGAVDSIHDSMDAFVTKLDPTGSSLVYSTYLGGISHDQGFGIAIDGDGRAYIVGLTYSADFPVTPGAYDGQLNAQADGFLAWIDPLGSQLEYATYLGKTSSISANDVAVDGSGFVYILGASGTPSAPTTPGAFDRSFNGEVDLYLMKLSPSGTCLSYATFLGGSLTDSGGAFVVGGEGTVYIAGWTDSVGFPVTPGAFDTILDGPQDGFLHKLTPDAGVNMISGTVVDEEGHPLPSFPVAESCGSSTTTSAAGQYQLGGLYPGKHTVAPADIHFHYDPPSRTVTLPPDAAAVDFIALPRYLSFLPYTSRPCLPVYFDGFDNVASGWPVRWDRDVTLEYLGGEYRMALHNDYSWLTVRPGAAFADFNLSGEVRNATGIYGSYGLVFGITPDWSQFYSYEIDPEGNFALFRYDGSWTVIGEGNSPALFGGIEKNTLRVEKTATKIELYANGQLIFERVMSTFTEARYVGLIVSTYAEKDVDARFDNFTLYNPGCGPGVETAGQAASLPALADWLVGVNER